MEDNLVEEIRRHIISSRIEKRSLNTEFFTKSGFTHVEKDNLNSGELANSWKKSIGNKEISIIHSVKSEEGLIMPVPDKVRVSLIIKNTETNEEHKEEYVWNERASPLSKEEIL